LNSPPTPLSFPLSFPREASAAKQTGDTFILNCQNFPASPIRQILIAALFIVGAKIVYVVNIILSRTGVSDKSVIIPRYLKTSKRKGGAR
jgi:hypothetical protein